MGEGNCIQNSGPAAIPWPKEKQEAFVSFVAEQLEKLKPLVVNETKVRNETEICNMLRPWGKGFCSSEGTLFGLIFRKFPELAEQFDLNVTQQNLWTPENLRILTEDDGPVKVAQRFLSYFMERWGRRWRVLIPSTNLEDVNLPPVEVTPGITVELRKIQDQESQYFYQKSGVSQQLFGDKSVFVVHLPAGDGGSAIRKAKHAIEQYLAPYYLYAIRPGQEEPWWVPRPERVRLFPYESVVPLDGVESRPFQVDVERLRRGARSLIQSVLPLDDEWVSSIREIVSKWHRKDFTDDLERHIVQATKWMFSAEDEESAENAYLKHSIAWEALFPRTKKYSRLKLCLWLVILALAKQDIWSLRTVSQAERLRDRRNSLAHPEPSAGLTGTLQDDLRILRRALSAAVENALKVRKPLMGQGPRVPRWSKILSRLVNDLSKTGAKWKTSLISPKRLQLLEQLGLCDADGHLTEEGLATRVEAQIANARLSWDNCEQSVRWLAHAFSTSSQCSRPHPRLHATLWVQKRLAECPNFADLWAKSGVPVQAPSDQELAELIGNLQREFGITPISVGWRSDPQYIRQGD